MPLQTEAETTQPTPVANPRSFAQWLEGLAAGECDWEMMFRGVLPALSENQDSGWELLALVDQHYRLHRISETDFQGLNTSLKALLLGSPSGARALPLHFKAQAANAQAAGRASSVKSAPFSKAPPVGTPPPSAEPPEAVVAAAAEAPSVAAVAVVPPRVAADPVPAPPPNSTRERKADPPQPRALVVDEVLRNRYRIRGVLGHGGMGTVYAAIDEFRLDQADGGQRVAIKVLHTEIVQRPQLLAELRSEFQRLQALSHPNIVRVHDFDRDEDLTFFTMEQLSGAPLSRVFVQRGPVPVYRPYAFTIIRRVGAAVAYAHSRAIVHGDLNPGNIFVTDQGEIRVLDFGASYRLHHEPTIPDIDELSRVAVATPSYASVEVLQGGSATVRDDLYALACVSYALLTGKHPFQGRNALQARAGRLAPRRPAGLSGRQWRVLRAGLRFERDQRPADLQEWVDQLCAESDAAPIPALGTLMGTPARVRGNAGWVTAVVIAIVAAVCGWGWANPDAVARTAADFKGSIARLLNDGNGGAADTVTATPADVPTADATVPLIPIPARTPAAVPPPAVATPDPPKTTLTRTARAPVSEGAATTAAAGNTYPQAQIEMAADELEVTPMNPVAAVIVRRRANYRENVSFKWWTESGTAKPGKDFVAVSPRTENLLSGERDAQLLVPIVTDPRRTESRSFYVVIDEPGAGAKLGSRTLTMVTIPPSE